MATQNCSARFPFLCYVDNLVLVKENKTWEEALEHCRALSSTSQPTLRYELVSVQPGEDQDYVMNRVMEADTEEVGSFSVTCKKCFYRCHVLKGRYAVLAISLLFSHFLLTGFSIELPLQLWNRYLAAPMLTCV